IVSCHRGIVSCHRRVLEFPRRDTEHDPWVFSWVRRAGGRLRTRGLIVAMQSHGHGTRLIRARRGAVRLRTHGLIVAMLSHGCGTRSGRQIGRVRA
ncbi:MAG: hypothetical protein KF757_10840, partial [Phycisphaeraceae bacterium]|nr:hypothetical protein [Phycisphaeraceae bacterium]